MSSNYSRTGGGGTITRSNRNAYKALHPLSTASTDPEEDGGAPLFGAENEVADRATTLARRQALVTGVYVPPHRTQAPDDQPQSASTRADSGFENGSPVSDRKEDEDDTETEDDQDDAETGGTCVGDPSQKDTKLAATRETASENSPEKQESAHNMAAGPITIAQPGQSGFPVNATNHGHQAPSAAFPYGLHNHQQFLQDQGIQQPLASGQSFASPYPFPLGNYPQAMPSQAGPFLWQQGAPPVMSPTGYPMTNANMNGGYPFPTAQGQSYPNMNSSSPSSTTFTPVAGIPGSQTTPSIVPENIAQPQPVEKEDEDGFKTVVSSHNKKSKKNRSNASASPVKVGHSGGYSLPPRQGPPKSHSQRAFTFYTRSAVSDSSDISLLCLDMSSADKETRVAGLGTGFPTAQETDNLLAESSSHREKSPTFDEKDDGRTAVRTEQQLQGDAKIFVPYGDTNEQQSSTPGRSTIMGSQGNHQVPNPGNGRYMPPHQRQQLVHVPSPMAAQAQFNPNMQAMTPAKPANSSIPVEIRGQRSAHLNRLTNTPTDRPSLEAAFDPQNFPFVESCKRAEPKNYGVVRIHNIPFATQRAEIIAFLGRNSKILNDSEEPVHIIMERVTAKTQDAYVEFYTLQDAMKAVSRHQEIVAKGRPARLGDRPVEVELSSQDELMRDLFPLATAVKFQNGRPTIVQKTHNEPWGDFHGFVTEEEMTMLVKHVEVPQRTAYSRQCPQRPFECMISTIKKIPWYMSEHITLQQRNAIYNSTEQLVRLLDGMIRHDRDSHVITRQLKRRLVESALSCPGFSVLQKDNIAHLDDRDDLGFFRRFNQPRFANCWTHLWTLCAKPDIPNDVIEWYINVIREETTANVQRLPIMDSQLVQAKGQGRDDFWGYFWYELSSDGCGPLPTGKAFDRTSLHDIAKVEMATIETVLRRALDHQY